MFTTTIKKKRTTIISLSTSNCNPKTLNTIPKLSENINYIRKFGFFLSVAQLIDFRLIFNDVYIDDPRTTSDIETNLYNFHCFENFQLSQSLVIDYMLEVSHENFYGWRYIECNKLDKYIRQVFKKTFMTRRFYIGRLGGYINQQLANFIINNQLSIQNKNNLCKYKKMYLILKIQILLKFEFDSPIPQQFIPAIETKTNSINN